MASQGGKNDNKEVRIFNKEELYQDIKASKKKKLSSREFKEQLRRLEIELVKLQEWVKARKLKVVVIFEGRDASGKGGVIKTISGCLNPRICRIVALGIPTEKEKTQWYFQRYVTELPAAGEIGRASCRERVFGYV